MNNFGWNVLLTIFYAFSVLLAAIHCIAIVHSNGFPIGLNWTTSSLALLDVLNRIKWKISWFFQHPQIILFVRPKWTTRFWPSAMLASPTRARIRRNVFRCLSESINASANRDITENIVNLWLMLVMETHVETMPLVLCLRKVASAVTVLRDIRVHDVRPTSTIAWVRLSVKTTPHALMALSLTLANVNQDSRVCYFQLEHATIRG